MYQPEHLQRWSADGPAGFDTANNYAGPDIGAWYKAPVMLTSDPELLDRSNWEVVTRDLLPLKTWVRESPTVAVRRFGHWAIGWYELLLIHESNEEALRRAEEWARALSRYPVADDEHFNQLEEEAASAAWKRLTLRERVSLMAESGRSIFAARCDDAPRDGEIYDALLAR